MKKFLFLCTWLSVSILAHSNLVKWDGEGNDGQWSTAANWLGDIVPGPGDDVVLDNNFVSAEYQVNLPPGFVSILVHSLVISPQAGTAITVVLPVSNTAPSALQATTGGDAIVLNAGAVLINASGAANGTPVSVTDSGFFRINNGGHYIHRTERGHTQNLVSRLSAAPGTEFGIFEFDVPAASFVLSLTGRVYGTIVFSAATHGASVIYSGNGVMPLAINGDLIVKGNATFSNGMAATMQIHHAVRVDASATFVLQNGANNNTIKVGGDILIAGSVTRSGSGVPELELQGEALQELKITGPITGDIVITINNSNDVQLITPFIIPFRLQLTKGRILSSETAMLVFGENAGYGGGSVESFIDGPIQKIGRQTSFIFPVGKAGIFAPCAYTDEHLQEGEIIEAEYVRKNPQSSFGNSYAPGIDHISYVEYWTIQKQAGTSPFERVGLTVHPLSFCRDLSSLFIAGYDAGASSWYRSSNTNVLPGTAAPPYITGKIEGSPTTNATVFTLGTTALFAENPLPLRLLDFSAISLNDQRVRVSWRIADCCTTVVGFEIERAIAQGGFVQVARTNSRPFTGDYVWYDTMPSTQQTAYRLKIRLSPIDSLLSDVVSIRHNIVDPVHATLQSDIAGGMGNVVLETTMAGQYTLKLVDAMGRLLFTTRSASSKGKTIVALPSLNGSKGLYFVELDWYPQIANSQTGNEPFKQTLKWLRR